MLFGSEIWCISNSEILILDRVHCKILRSILGLPTRCPSSALNFLMGSLGVCDMISQRKLSFIFPIICLSSDSLARNVLCSRVANGYASSSVIYSWGRLLQEHSLPSLPSLLEVAPCKPSSWKRSIKLDLVLRTKALDQFFLQCSSLPIAGCDGRRFLAGKSLQDLNVTKGDR